MKLTKFTTRQLTIVSIMSGITIVMIYTPIGMIPLFGISATITQIPTIITAILLGPIAGAYVGFVFGIVTIIRAISSPLSPIDPLFVNPLVSVLPRVLIAFAAYYAYEAFSKINKTLGVIAGAMCGSLINTFGVLAALYFFFAQKLVAALSNAGMEVTAGKFVWLVASTNGILEVVLVTIICLPLVAALKKVVVK